MSTYCLLKATALCKGVVSKSLKIKLTEKLKNKAFSILIDETTDLSTNKLLAIVVRHYDAEAEQVLDDLLALVEVKNATGESLFTAVEDKDLRTYFRYYKILNFNIVNIK